jgi:hypothetical protein
MKKRSAESREQRAKSKNQTRKMIKCLQHEIPIGVVIWVVE